MEINFLHKCSSHQTNQKLKKKLKKRNYFTFVSEIKILIINRAIKVLKLLLQ